ncbi:MAG TPA: hypothetical protein QF468_07240 [Nitrospinota bacterium]|jgi:hypothetical protein|nr:hypothetical protein [Nitrospinota bacterium]|tara:strand:- start:3037 stop:3999 length:963 start_codon:yes stop_codon:yes gene_type:complete
MFDEEHRKLGWHGYADAKPSESIQKHELPGLSVAVVFPHMPSVDIIDLPVKQYKDYKARLKGTRARELAQWLVDQKNNSLLLKGFFHAHTQVSAATFGLDLIQELPRTRVEPHYETYRLFFGDEHVDFAQAIALEYYFVTINLGILRASSSLPKENRRLFVAMDRFPGNDIGNSIAGQKLQHTQGSKFLEFVRKNSSTAIGIEKLNKSKELTSNFGTLDWWKWKDEDTWKKGKSHPHFVLPDWLAAAAIAHEFRDDLVASFAKEKDGVNAADGLEILYNAFKTFDLWSLDRNTLPHIRAEEKVWDVPNEAREFVFERAER